MTSTTLVGSVRAPVSISRRYLAAGTFIALGLIDIFVFGLFAHRGDAVFALSLPGATPHVPSIRVPGATTAYVAGVISIGLGILRAAVDLPRWGKRLTIAVVLLCFLVALLSWADAGNSVGALEVVDLLQGTLTASIPLVLGALAGLLGERSGVINIAIEGQLLTGAFVAAAVASDLAPRLLRRNVSTKNEIRPHKAVDLSEDLRDRLREAFRQPRPHNTGLNSIGYLGEQSSKSAQPSVADLAYDYHRGAADYYAAATGVAANYWLTWLLAYSGLDVSRRVSR